MYRKHHNGQLLIAEFHVPFGGTLDPNNRWVVFSSLMPWEELEETYAPQFSPTTGAPAKSVRLAFGALFIKLRLGLTDEETVEQIRENAYMQFFLGFAGYSSKAPFDPSMMVHFRKRFAEKDLKRINELTAGSGTAEAALPLFITLYAWLSNRVSRRIALEHSKTYFPARDKQSTPCCTTSITGCK